MAISLWFALAVFALVTAMAWNRTVAAASERKPINRKTPTDQLRPSPRHYPIADVRAYS